MAGKKTSSQAQKAAAAKKKNKAAGKNTAANTKKNAASANKASQTTIPVRVITSLVCAGLFILFLVIFFEPQGAIVRLIQNIILGIVGKVSFYVAIPGLLYLFVIQAFSGKRPIKLRSICMIVFILLCGAISQLGMPYENLPSGGAFVLALWKGGAAGTTAGVLCGSFAVLLNWLLGTAISYIVLFVAAALTLLAAFQITIPSIIRAIQNRPRADWEDEIEEKQEPAAVVVNHLANKRIAYVEQKRRRQEEQLELDMDLVEETPAPVARKTPKPSNSDFMRHIDTDVASPVAAAGKAVTEDLDIDILIPQPRTMNSAPKQMPIPPVMPSFEKDEPIPEAPILEKPPVAEEPVQMDTPIEIPGKVTAKQAQESAAQVAAEIANAATQVKQEYRFPPIDLLTAPNRGVQDGTMEMRENTRRLNETLASFKIDAHIINVTRGPSVTRYEVELDKGVRLNKLTTCADDIALSLGASGVRIAAVPGKISVVGIEVPNRAVTTVSLREVIDSYEFSRSKSKATFAVGKDIGGSCIVGNIAKLPHMLIAGTTGSGKSVCMNSLIISLLYKASPEDVKLIMVDPKMVELGIYNSIPHLLIPVVTDPKKAAGALQWAVTEMMRRYETMRDAGVRDLDSYNSMVETELLIEILSFGPTVKVLGPEDFLNKVKERIRRQMELLKRI